MIHGMVPDHYTPKTPSDESYDLQSRIIQNSKEILEAEARLARLEEERDDLQKEWQFYYNTNMRI